MTSVVAGVLVAANLVARAGGSEPPAPTGPPETVHVVRPGDTLWAIARERVGPEGDPRPMVVELRQANGLGRRLLPVGARLTVPPA